MRGGEASTVIFVLQSTADICIGKLTELLLIVQIVSEWAWMYVFFYKHASAILLWNLEMEWEWAVKSQSTSC